MTKRNFYLATFGFLHATPVRGFSLKIITDGRLTVIIKLELSTRRSLTLNNNNNNNNIGNIGLGLDVLLKGLGLER